MSLWQDIEVLQKTKAQLEEQYNSLNDKAKNLAQTLEQAMKLVEQTLGTQEERVNKLENQLKDKDEVISKLEARIAGLEQMLKRPGKEETVTEEPIKEVTVEEPEQPTEMTVQTVADGIEQQTEEVQIERQEKKRKRWM